MNARQLRQFGMFFFTVACVWFAAAAQANGDDFALANTIAAAMRDGGMKQYSIGVGCRSGVVTLRGTVANKQQRELALGIALNTEGATQVVDQLQIGDAKAAASNVPKNPFAGRAQPAQYEAVLPEIVFENPFGPPAARSGLTSLIVRFASIAAERYLLSGAQLDVDLDDGSRIVARAVEPGNFRLTSKLGTLDVPLRLVESVERKSDGNVRVRLANGDTMTGTIEFSAESKVRLIAAHGEMTVAPAAIVRIQRRESPRLARN
jgi:hypothetical protein